MHLCSGYTVLLSDLRSRKKVLVVVDKDGAGSSRYRIPFRWSASHLFDPVIFGTSNIEAPSRPGSPKPIHDGPDDLHKSQEEPQILTPQRWALRPPLPKEVSDRCCISLMKGTIRLLAQPDIEFQITTAMQ
jgi:hypothetical protein